MTLAVCERLKPEFPFCRMYHRMLQHRNNEEKDILLLLFYLIWQTERFFHSWKEKIVIQILKQEKDWHKSSVSLFSCVGKIFECSTSVWSNLRHKELAQCLRSFLFIIISVFHFILWVSRAGRLSLSDYVVFGVGSRGIADPTRSRNTKCLPL